MNQKQKEIKFKNLKNAVVYIGQQIIDLADILESIIIQLEELEENGNN